MHRYLLGLVTVLVLLAAYLYNAGTLALNGSTALWLVGAAVGWHLVATYGLGWDQTHEKVMSSMKRAIAGS